MNCLVLLPSALLFAFCIRASTPGSFGAFPQIIKVSASDQTAKQRAIAELAAAGLSWVESEREVIATDAGRTQLKDLTGVQRALRTLQPRSLDLTLCSALRSVDGLRGLRSLQSINLSACPALQNVDAIAGLDRLKKIYVFESMNISPKSLDALERRFPKCYIVLPDGTGLNPPRDRD